ncbi:MAG: hypothetical protein K2K82_04400, partial [Muribaculaceae bacterium]|nr:hypothetical protein [Muribaculaceae bacterium]
MRLKTTLLALIGTMMAFHSLAADFADTVDYYLDYNFVGEGDTFTVTAHINEEKSPAGSYIKRISG